MMLRALGLVAAIALLAVGVVIAGLLLVLRPLLLRHLDGKEGE